MSWKVETLNEVVDAELLALPEDMQARFFRIAELIESKGLPSVGGPHVKHLAGKLWEIRMSGRNGIARAIYQAANPRRVIVLRIFVEKSRKTLHSDIELALQRAWEIRS